MSTMQPVVEGWFTAGEEPALLGLTCPVCDTTVFPPNAITCPNAACTNDDLEPVELPRHGVVWSWATNHYAPPAPYVSPEPFEPYTVLAVELEGAGITVLGQLDGSQDPAELRIGARVEVISTELLGSDGPRSMFGFALVDDR